MRIVKDLFQDFLIYVDAVSSIIFIMKMNAIWILTTKLKRNYQIFIQGRLIKYYHMDSRNSIIMTFHVIPLARGQGLFDVNLPSIWSN